jgi:hypothetical protein
MIIKKIGYGASYESKDEFFNHEWSKPSVNEAELEIGDNPIECFHKLRDICNTFHKETLSIKVDSWISVNGEVKNLLEDTLPVDTMILEIEACTELTKDPTKGLLSFEFTPKDAAQKAAYDLKKLQLTKK